MEKSGVFFYLHQNGALFRFYVYDSFVNKFIKKFTCKRYRTKIAFATPKIDALDSIFQIFSKQQTNFCNSDTYYYETFKIFNPVYVMQNVLNDYRHFLG
jgi:hypothetical protein